MSPLDTAIHRLFELGHLKTLRAKEVVSREVTKEVIKGVVKEVIKETVKYNVDIHSYSYSYLGRLVPQRVTVNPVMKKHTLQKIVENATEGSMQDMLTVAMLYNVGYGLPKDRALSEVWSEFAVMQPTMEFNAACKLLNRHLSECADDIWPLRLTAPVNKILTQLNTFAPNAGNVQGATVFPRISGIRVFLIYRQADEGTPHLYAGYYKDGTGIILDLDSLVRLGAPRFFGEVNDSCIIDSYTPFGRHKLYVVVATIAVPESMRAEAAKCGKNTREIFKLFLSDSSPRKTQENFDNSFFVKQVEETKVRLTRLKKTVNKGRKYERRYAEEMERYAEQKAALANSNPIEEYNNYLSTLPERFLKLVAHELYAWEDNALKVAPIPASQIDQHLSAIGFQSYMFGQYKFHSYSVSKDISDMDGLAREFEKEMGFRVTGLIIQPKSKNASLRYHAFNRG